jgi:hypothetical protein
VRGLVFPRFSGRVRCLGPKRPERGSRWRDRPLVGADQAGARILEQRLIL